MGPLLVVLGALAALLLGGCGAPSWTYVTNSADRAYLKVPTSWTQIAPAEFKAELGVDPAPDSSKGVWIEAYDSASHPSLEHLLGPSADSPALLVSVQSVPEESRGQVSLDTVRDFVYPVSPTSRQQLALTGGHGTLTGFTLVSDQVLTPGKGIRGVRTIYSYRINGGEPQVFDQVGYINDDSSKLYLAFARCSADCFEKRQSEIDGVVSSFTVREAL